MVIDGRGIVWEESVRYTGERGREDVDRMRVEAVRQRTTNSRSKEQGGGGIGVVAEDGATRGSGSRMSGQGAAASVQVMVDQVARREGLNDLSKGDVCVLGIHCLLSDKGFGDDELPTRFPPLCKSRLKYTCIHTHTYTHTHIHTYTHEGINAETQGQNFLVHAG